MTGRDRVKNAMHYRPVDKVPLQYYYCPVGYYEHGEKLNELYSAHPGDFEPFQRMPIPVIPPECLNSKGEYHEYRMDEWGVEWEYRIFGVTGIPSRRPIASADEIASYRLPEPPAAEGPEFESFARMIRKKQEDGYYAFGSGGSIYERLLHLYGDENVLCDILSGEPEISELEDRLADYGTQMVLRAVRAGTDGIALGDDFGTERAMVMGPETWRSFFKPRLRRMIEPAVKAGLDVHFHSCGYILPILEDLREIGITSIWPQIPAYDMRSLAERCRSLGLAVAIHTDRARTMTYGTPDEVRELVLREFETFRMADGGSWYYVEADNGFPFENLRALVETIALFR